MTAAADASTCAVNGASPEFLMVVECCRAAFQRGEENRVADLAARVDWARFVRTARYHRVQGLVWKSLSPLGTRIPPDVATAIGSDAREIAVANLRIAVESRELRDAFAEAGVALLFLKGLTVGGLAYGDASLKMGWDIDLLIDPAQLEKAAGVMRGRGFRLVIPAAAERLQPWHRLRKDSEWINPRGIHVELHTRLAENRRLIPEIAVHSPSRDVAVAAGIALPTLRHDDLHAYLCVHGASSLWFRLKWITDLAAILDQVDQPEIARLHARAGEQGVGRASAAALLLADALFGTLSVSPLRSALMRDRSARWLCRASLRQLAGRAEPREPTSAVGGTAAIHLAQLLLVPGARFKVGEALRQARAALAGSGAALEGATDVAPAKSGGAIASADEYRS